MLLDQVLHLNSLMGTGTMNAAASASLGTFVTNKYCTCVSRITVYMILIALFKVPTNLVFVGASNVPSVVLANTEVDALCNIVNAVGNNSPVTCATSCSLCNFVSNSVNCYSQCRVFITHVCCCTTNCRLGHMLLCLHQKRDLYQPPLMLLMVQWISWIESQQLSLGTNAAIFCFYIDTLLGQTSCAASKVHLADSFLVFASTVWT